MFDRKTLFLLAILAFVITIIRMSVFPFWAAGLLAVVVLAQKQYLSSLAKASFSLIGWLFAPILVGLGSFTLIIAALLPEKKRCRFCKEVIKKSASKCPNCQSDLATTQITKDEKVKENRNFKLALAGSALALVLALVIPKDNSNKVVNKTNLSGELKGVSTNTDNKEDIKPSSSPSLKPSSKETNEQVKITIPDVDKPFLGNDDAKVVILEFVDFECPYCKKFAFDTLPNIKAKYIDTGKVKFAQIQYPLEKIHKKAKIAAIAVVCAGQQDKYWQYHDLLFTNQSKWTLEDDPSELLEQYALSLNLDTSSFKSCLSNEDALNEINNDIDIGKNNNISGTPAFFINSSKLDGNLPFSEFEKIIEEELNKS